MRFRHVVAAGSHSTALSAPMGTSSATTTTYHNFIDGAWVPSVSGELFEDRNPANPDEVVGVFQKSTAADVADAIDAARLAYERWRLVPAPRRAELLFRAAQLIADRKESLARDMTREMGKVLDETRGDVQEAIDMTFFMAGEGRRQYGQTVPSELRDKFAMSIRQPVGVSAIITPWNFPMAIPSWKIVPALIGGKNVVMIMDDADLDLAVEGCLWGGFGTTGQRCTAASRVVVHESVYKTFLEEFVARARALRVGDGLDPKTEMGPSVSEGQLQTVIK